MQIIQTFGEQEILRYGRKRKGRSVILPLVGPFWEELIWSLKAPTSEWMKGGEEQEEQKPQAKNFNKCLQIFANFLSYSFPPKSCELSRVGIMSSIFI